MNPFTVVSAAYDGTSGDQNPLVGISGTVNGKNVFPQVFFRYLDAANAAGGSGLQQALTAILWNWYVRVWGSQFTPFPTPIPFPTFPASDVVAVHSQGPYPQPDVIYVPALIGSWMA
jgi:hypothetical protein